MSADDLHLEKWSAWEDLNLRSPAPEAGALARLGYTRKMVPQAGLSPTRTGLKNQPLDSLHSGTLVTLVGIEPNVSGVRDRVLDH